MTSNERVTAESAAEYATDKYLYLTRLIKTCEAMIDMNPPLRGPILSEFSTTLMNELEEVTMKLQSNNNSLIASNELRLVSLMVSDGWSFVYFSCFSLHLISIFRD